MGSKKRSIWESFWFLFFIDCLIILGLIFDVFGFALSIDLAKCILTKIQKKHNVFFAPEHENTANVMVFPEHENTEDVMLFVSEHEHTENVLLFLSPSTKTK